MKKIIFIFALSIFLASTYAQNFTWIKGSNTISASNSYGTQSVSAPSNTPGQRHGCAKWVDSNGNLWLFGGEAPNGSWWNDLWKYNPTTNEWTWIRGLTTPNGVGTYGTLGVATSSNEPKAREFPAYWTDNAGNFWMFGGRGYDFNTSTSQKLADLWRYNPTTNQWTWMKGPGTFIQPGNYGTQGIAASTNAPGGRSESGFSTDAAGNLWLFGGVGHVSSSIQGRLNDVWKFDIGSNNWTWVSGNNAYGPSGVYGTMSVPSVANHPGGREFPICWLDPSGSIYLFGGEGRDTSVVNPQTGYLNDLWKYNPTANTWAWVGGSKAVNGAAVYGTQGISNSANIPGGRRAPAHWTDASNKTWIFGGWGILATTPAGYLNDLFRYDPTLNQWTWMKGSTLLNQNGTYGTLGVPAIPNIPGAREYSNYWTDLNGKFWLFGGEGYDVSGTSVGHMNDLWRYSVPCNPDSITVAPGKFICSGTSTTLTAVSGGPGTVWYPTATSTSSISGGSTLAVSSLTTGSSPTTYSYYAEANSCTLTPRASITITVNPLPTLTVTTTHTLLCFAFHATLTVTGALNYTWTNTNPVYTTPVVTVSPANTTTYNVIGMDANGCTNTAKIVQKVQVCGGIVENKKDAIHKIYPNPSNGIFTITVDNLLKNAQFLVSNALGQKVFEQILYTEETILKPNLIRGVYFYQLTLNGSETVSGKLVIE